MVLEDTANKGLLLLLAASLVAGPSCLVKETLILPAQRRVISYGGVLKIVKEDEQQQEKLKLADFWKKENQQRNGERIIKDPRKLEQLLFADHNITQPELLAGLIDEESRFLINIGCNPSKACGVVQLKRAGVAGALITLYGGWKPFANFQEKYAARVQEKRKLIDQKTDNYFSDLFMLYSCATKRMKEINPRKNKKEYTLLGIISRMYNEGFAISYGPAKKVYRRNIIRLQRVDGLDQYLSSLTGKKKDWFSHLKKQRIKIYAVHEQISDQDNYLLSGVLGDALLGYYLDSFGSVSKAYKRYNGGTEKRKRIYLKNIQRFFRRNREHFPLPKTPLKRPYPITIASSYVR
ncbi:MAG: hypothetical protein ABIA37_00845 [Candidatus Woesearchaeota archaeon]